MRALACGCLLLSLVPAATQTNQLIMKSKTELATLGGGCFWCMEALLQTMDGVVGITSGFAGGHVADPTYQQVCAGDTGHAEVVQIEFDPARLSYVKLLELFWKAHDPTTLNRQGPDSGTQYRSIILYHNQEQKKCAEQSKAEAARFFVNPIVTQIVALEKFYPAEAYHQNYYRNNPKADYCRIVISPKLSKFQSRSSEKPGGLGKTAH